MTLPRGPLGDEITPKSGPPRSNIVAPILLALLTAYPAIPVLSQTDTWPDTPEIGALKSQLAAVAAEKGNDHPDLVDLLEQIGGAYATLGGFVRATPYFERELTIVENGPEKDPERTVLLLEVLGTVYRLQGDTGHQRAIRLRALPMVLRELGPDHPVYGMIMLDLAGLHLLSGNLAAAEAAFDTAWTALKTRLFQAAHEMTDLNRRVGLLLLDLGRYDQAEQQLAYALTVRSEVLDMMGDAGRQEAMLYMAPMQNALGMLYVTVGLYERAEPLLHKALAAYETEYGHDHPLLEDILANLAALYRGMGNLARSTQFAQRTDAVHRRGLGYTYLPGWPGRTAVRPPPPVRPLDGPFADARMGDEATYENGAGLLAQKRAVVAVTPLVAVIQTLRWDTAGRSWIPGQEQIASRSRTETTEMQVGEDTVTVGGRRIPCRILLASGEQETKLWVAGMVPAGGLVKMEQNGEVILRLRDFRRGDGR